LRKRGDVWWINKKINGQRYQQSTGCKTLDEAVEALRLGLIDDNPVSRTKPVKVDSKVPVYLDESEIIAFLTAAKSFDEWAQTPRQFGTLLHNIFVSYF